MKMLKKYKKVNIKENMKHLIKIVLLSSTPLQ